MDFFIHTCDLARYISIGAPPRTQQDLTSPRHAVPFVVNFNIVAVVN